MIKVYPLAKLQAKTIFKDSHGKRHEMSPAQSMDEVGKKPVYFNGEDPKVAAQIAEMLEDKRVEVSKGDAKIIYATLNNEAPTGEEAVAAEAKVSEAVGKAIQDVEADHAEVLKKVAEDNAKAIEAAVSKVGEKHAEMVTKLQADLLEKQEKADGKLREAQDVAIKGMQDSSQKALDKLAADHAKLIEGINAAHAKEVGNLKKQ